MMRFPLHYVTISTVLMLVVAVLLVYLVCRNVVAPDHDQDNGSATLSFMKETVHSQRGAEGGFHDNLGCESVFYDSQGYEGSFHDNRGCRELLTCHDMQDVVLQRKIGEGAVKMVHLASWHGRKVVHSSLAHPHHYHDFLHGAEMLGSLQSSPSVVRLLGTCLELPTPAILTEYHPLGSADNIDVILAGETLRGKNTIEVRFRLCLDYVGIIAYLHSSPVGTRIMCDSNDVPKTLSQFLITEEFRLIVNDLDALPLVDRAAGKLARCGHKELDGDFVAPEQLWPFPEEDFRDEDMPPYSEKSDIWKIPDITDALLSSVEHHNIVRFHLFRIHQRCKELDAELRPTADDVLEIYQETYDSIILDY